MEFVQRVTGNVWRPGGGGGGGSRVSSHSHHHNQHPTTLWSTSKQYAGRPARFHYRNSSTHRNNQRLSYVSRSHPYYHDHCHNHYTHRHHRHQQQQHQQQQQSYQRNADTPTWKRIHNERHRTPADNNNNSRRWISPLRVNNNQSSPATTRRTPSSSSSSGTFCDASRKRCSQQSVSLSASGGAALTPYKRSRLIASASSTPTAKSTTGDDQNQRDSSSAGTTTNNNSSGSFRRGIAHQQQRNCPAISCSSGSNAHTSTTTSPRKSSDISGGGGGLAVSTSSCSEPSKSLQLYGGKSLLVSHSGLADGGGQYGSAAAAVAGCSGVDDGDFGSVIASDVCGRGGGGGGGGGVCEPLDSQQHDTDPLYIGLPNYGNSCYQNATLQVLFGLAPFVAESVATAVHSPVARCRTLHALSRLMLLRQRARRRSVSSLISELRGGVFSAIDPAFSGYQMQDANEFLLRLLDTMKDELDSGAAKEDSSSVSSGGGSGGSSSDCDSDTQSDSDGKPLNPVRSSFEYETLESYRCCRCERLVQRRQLNTSWFVNVPRRPADSSRPPPTLQDALRLSVRPDRRELRCDACGHNECTVATAVTRLPRVLIVQLNRYVYMSDEARKIRATVQIPRYVSLGDYVSDDVASPVEWLHRRLPDEVDTLIADASSNSSDDKAKSDDSSGTAADNTTNANDTASVTTDSHTDGAVSSSPTPDVSQTPSSSDTTAATTSGESCCQSNTSVEPGDVPAPAVAAAVAVASAEDEEQQQLQEAIRRSLEDNSPSAVDDGVNNTGDSDRGVVLDDDATTSSAATATASSSAASTSASTEWRPGDVDAYRLVGVVSHYGSATHSGHYVSDVYNVARRRWFHYDDRHVTSVDERHVVGESHQRNGYIFFYMHKSVCSQVASVELSAT